MPCNRALRKVCYPSYKISSYLAPSHRELSCKPANSSLPTDGFLDALYQSTTSETWDTGIKISLRWCKVTLAAGRGRIALGVGSRDQPILPVILTPPSCRPLVISPRVHPPSPLDSHITLSPPLRRLTLLASLLQSPSMIASQRGTFFCSSNLECQSSRPNLQPPLTSAFLDCLSRPDMTISLCVRHFGYSHYTLTSLISNLRKSLICSIASAP
jgi:hypothetical protein